MIDSAPPSRRLLAADERPPFNVLKSGAKSPFVLLGDHAGREIPRSLGHLGLPAVELDRHIACDLGVAALGAALSERLGACFVAQRFSRLVIDANRDPARDDSIPQRSDGTSIPGNLELADQDRERRVAEVFRPYHARIAEELDARGGAPAIVVALHSFTPELAGRRRPWRYGVLHLGASLFSTAMLRVLVEASPPGTVGDNAPYRMDETDYTVPHHAVRRGLDYLELEVRQDLLTAADGIAATADLLSRLLPAALADGERAEKSSFR